MWKWNVYVCARGEGAETKYLIHTEIQYFFNHFIDTWANDNII